MPEGVNRNTPIINSNSGAALSESPNNQALDDLAVFVQEKNSSKTIYYNTKKGKFYTRNLLDVFRDRVLAAFYGGKDSVSSRRTLHAQAARTKITEIISKSYGEKAAKQAFEEAGLPLKANSLSVWSTQTLLHNVTQANKGKADVLLIARGKELQKEEQTAHSEFDAAEQKNLESKNKLTDAKTHQTAAQNELVKQTANLRKFSESMLNPLEEFKATLDDAQKNANYALRELNNCKKALETANKNKSLWRSNKNKIRVLEQEYADLQKKLDGCNGLLSISKLNLNLKIEHDAVHRDHSVAWNNKEAAGKDVETATTELKASEEALAKQQAKLDVANADLTGDVAKAALEKTKKANLVAQRSALWTDRLSKLVEAAEKIRSETQFGTPSADQQAIVKLSDAVGEYANAFRLSNSLNAVLAKKDWDKQAFTDAVGKHGQLPDSLWFERGLIERLYRAALARSPVEGGLEAGVRQADQRLRAALDDKVADIMDDFGLTKGRKAAGWE
jgi:hypothetical protein